jgi:hypothetical protein
MARVKSPFANAALPIDVEWLPFALTVAVLGRATLSVTWPWHSAAEPANKSVEKNEMAAHLEEHARSLIDPNSQFGD